jgi:hypothetical protein
MALKALILRVVADDEKARPKSSPAHPWGTVRSRRSHDVEQRLAAANTGVPAPPPA